MTDFNTFLGSFKFWNSLNIPYVPKYAYTEKVAFRESGRASADDMVISFYKLGRVIEALRTGQKLLDITLDTGSVTAAQEIYAENIITGSKINIMYSSPPLFPELIDLAQLRTDYLTYLHDSFRYLDMKGILTIQQVFSRLNLISVYVPLKLYPSSSLYSQEVSALSIEEVLEISPAIVILGDPGAGKSTLLKMLALTLAKKPDGPLPIVIPLNAYARRLERGEISLAQFMSEYYANRQRKLSEVSELFNMALVSGQAVVLLDGLDEIRIDRAYLIRLIQDFVNEYITVPIEANELMAGNRIIVTSRIVGYEETPLVGRQWYTYVLTDFSRDEIKQFISQFTLAFAMTIQGDTEVARQAAERERRDLLEAIFSNPSLEQLATNPLLLIILVLIKYQGVTLPEQRVKLYELYLQSLIGGWNLARSLDQYPVGPDIDYEETVQVLAPLALWLHRESPGSGLVDQGQLEYWLTHYYSGDEWRLPRGEARRRAIDFIKNVGRYSNILIERGENQYGFSHLALEEMLAAKGIAQLDDDSTVLAIFKEYLLDPKWSVILRLAVGTIGILQQRAKKANTILQQILQMEMSDENKGRQVVFAAETMLEVGMTTVSPSARDQIISALTDAIQSAIYPVDVKRDAGYLLGQLGDPRPGVTVLPPLLTSFLEGEFLYGDEKQKRHTMSFCAGVYPVTNAQFTQFISDGGYENSAWWSNEGWQWRQGILSRSESVLTQPAFWEDKQWNRPNCPVVGISLYEAEAFCRWLSATYGHIYRLPTEDEWERLARGQDGREYPWGDTWQEGFANTKESGIGQSSAVGMFPSGASPVGAYDCIGNVWEWCINSTDEDNNNSAILRGGSWDDSGGNLSCSTKINAKRSDRLATIGFRVISPIE